MPTLFEWQQALLLPRRVVVESSADLVSEVRQLQQLADGKRQQAGKPIIPRKTVLTPVAPFAPQRELLIAPAHLLHRLGVVTTPPVENLADICSTWAYLRYLWAFEIPAPGAVHPRLRLSEAARNIDFHQKGLLSDQIGVGMAAILLGTYLNAPLAADVSVAMADPQWPIDLQHDTSPDYLFFNTPQTQLFVVECKGTQTSRSSSLKQLRRGIEQVPSVVFTDGRKPPSLVVATCLSKSGTRTLVLDPPGDDADDESRIGARRVSQREWRIEDVNRFAYGTRSISEAKVLSFAGAVELAAAKLERAGVPTARTRRTASPAPQTTENEFGVFRGVRQRVGVLDRLTVEIFQGLDVGVLKALQTDDPEQTWQEVARFQHGVEDAQSPTPLQRVLSRLDPGVLTVTSAGPDGSLFEVRVSEP